MECIRTTVLRKSTTSAGVFRFVLSALFVLVATGLSVAQDSVVAGPDTVAAPPQIQTPADSAAERVTPATVPGVPVLLEGDTLFRVYSPLGEFVPSERARQVSRRLLLLSKNDWPLDSLRAVENEGVTDVLLDTLRVFSVTLTDARTVGKDRHALAEEYRSIVVQAIENERAAVSLNELLLLLGSLLLAVLLLGLSLWVMHMIFPRLYALMESWEGKFFPTIRFRSHEIISAATITTVHIALLKGFRLAVTLGVLYFFILYTLATIPWTQTWDPGPLLQGVFFSIITVASALALLRAVNAFYKTLGRRIARWKGTLIKAVRVKSIEVLSEDRIADLLVGASRMFHLATLVVLFYFSVTLLFSFFDISRTWASSLFGYVIDPLESILFAFINYLPNVFFILVILFLTRYVIMFTRLIFTEMEKGTISLPGFHREWADPTFKIVRFLIFVFAAIIIFPYLPGSDSPAFQGISVFLGVLFSLGSTSAVANVVSGIVLTYMRPFRVGDRVRISDTIGEVIEKSILVTRVRTIKNVDVTIPNAMVLGSHIINFSSSASERGLILHTAVTIGYDAPWRKVHETLIAAARSVDGILKEPAPFILQTALNDFSVSYELNAYTDQPERMAALYSELHSNVQDRFNEAGIEIMSPSYTAVRDGNQSTIPTDYLPKHYTAPGFRVFPFGNPFKKEDPPADK